MDHVILSDETITIDGDYIINENAGGDGYICDINHNLGKSVKEVIAIHESCGTGIYKVCRPLNIKVAAPTGEPSRDKPASLLDNASLTDRRDAAGVPPSDNTSQLEISGPCSECFNRMSCSFKNIRDENYCQFYNPAPLLQA
jgi:hypothetical protein